MASSSFRLLRQSIPAVAAFAAGSSWETSRALTEASAPPVDQEPMQPEVKSFGMVSDAKGDFHGLFPKRQLWQPKVEYPLWDINWDNKKPPSTGNEDEDRQRMKKIRKEGVTRHIILVRHGQYDETEKDDAKRLLTELGRKQADLTGRRLKEMMDGSSKEFGPCRIKVVRVSNLARAKETADIIASHLPGVEYAQPDHDLNEGRPSHNLPGGRVSDSTIQKTDDHHQRIERAFNKYFQRAPLPASMLQESEDGGSEEKGDEVKHEFEIVVCHANVIRYFFCRALQLPPEAWLRLCTFNCSLTYLTIRPTGTVSCRMLGDVGHIPYGMSTFSMHTGFNW